MTVPVMFGTSLIAFFKQKQKNNFIIDRNFYNFMLFIS